MMVAILEQNFLDSDNNDGTGLEVAQVLACHGADLEATWVSTDGTKLSLPMIAEINARPHIADWIKSIQNHTPYQICARVRNHTRMRELLRSGKCDPRIAAPGTHPAAKLATEQLDFPVCAQTTALARAAVQRWSPGRHFLHHPKVRAAVKLLLHILNRLDLVRGHLPRMPREIWLYIFTFISWR